VTEENSDRLWKKRNLFKILNKTFSKFYSLSEHLTVDEIILFKGGVNFRQYIPKKHKSIGIRIYKPFDKVGYKCDMTEYSVLDGLRKFHIEIPFSTS